MHRLLLLSLCVASLSGCYSMRGSEGGGQTRVRDERAIDPADIAVPPGYRIEAVATGLTFPTGVAFDGAGVPHVVEAGYSYGEKWTTPRLLRVEADGSTEVVTAGENPPWTGVDFHDGAFFVAEGGAAEGGRIVRIDPESGEITRLIENLPSLGDHHTNGPRIGPDGGVYFGVGTATNAAVVGVDNAEFGWLGRHPDFHDIPPVDIVLAGINFPSDNPLTDDPGDRATTGAYVPFGTATSAGQTIPGRMPATGAVMRIPAGGGEPELVAWGLRNPYGLAFSEDGGLYVVENSFDERGSRPVWGTGDVLWRIDLSRLGLWYGWPDFHAGQPLDTPRYERPGGATPQRLLAEQPNDPPQPAAILGVHAAASGLDVDPGPFGYGGQLFIAEFGDMAPGVGKVLAPVGFKVVRVEPETGVVHDFAVNRGKTTGPASLLGGGGLERPVAARFSPDGESLYVVDFGVMTISKAGPKPREATGVLWRITRVEASR